MIGILQGETLWEQKPGTKSGGSQSSVARWRRRLKKSDWENKKEISKETVITETKKRIFQEGRSGHFCEIQVKKQIGGQLKK